MSDIKPQAWCSFWAKTHKDGICLRLRGAHEALTDLMREIREAREEIERMRAVMEAANELYFLLHYSAFSGWTLRYNGADDAKIINTFRAALSAYRESRQEEAPPCSE